MRVGAWVLLCAGVAVVSVGLTYGYLHVQPPAAEGQAATAQVVAMQGDVSQPAEPGGTPAGGRMESGAAPLFATSQPATRTFVVRLPWIGVVQSQATVQLTALVPGEVKAIEVEDQAAVEAGATVMRLGGPNIEPQQTRLRANVESLKAQLSLAEETLSRLQKNVEAVAKNTLATTRENEVKLKAQLRDAQAAYDAFEQQVVIAAPMAGVFTNRRVSVGQAVSATEVVGEIVDATHLRIAASLFAPPDSTLEGKQATIRVSEEETLAGVIESVLPTKSSIGATMVWIEGPAIDQHLRPGQTLSGTVSIETARAAVAVPASAVVYGPDEQAYVFVQEAGKYAQRSVRLGISQDGWVEVLSGVEPGETVVTQGAYELFYREFRKQFKVED